MVWLRSGVRMWRRLMWLVPVLLSLLVVDMAVAEEAPAPRGHDLEVMQDFEQQTKAERAAFELTEKDKRTILFYMGAALLVLLLATAWFGISMAMLGKEVFVAHMICAGLSLTLAIAHAVTAIVWFFPF